MGYLFMKSTMGKEGSRVTKFGAILQKMIVDGFWGGGVFVWPIEVHIYKEQFPFFHLM